MTRTLPIDSALLDAALLFLRRDSSESALRWTLGALGAAEVDVAFVREDALWSTTVRLWNSSGLAVAAATLTLVPAGADEVTAALAPTLPPAPAWGADGRGLTELSQAAVDEFAEELLWHASRAGVTERG